MKMFNKKSILTVLGVSLVLCLTGSFTAFAATNPSLGAADSYSVLAQSGITGTGTISGNVENNGIGAAITALTNLMVGGTIYSSDAGVTGGGGTTTALNALVQANASTAYTATIPGLPIEGTPIVGAELNGITRGPGVYDLVGATITLSGGSITLDGPGTYIFRVPAILTTSGSVNLINGARACDVFWNVGTGANINGTSFAGTILSGTTIAFGAGVTLDGRALSVGGTAVTMNGTTISGPTCAAPVQGNSLNGTITVVKTVINDNGGTKTVADFPLFVNGVPVKSGDTNSYMHYNAYPVTETSDPKYTRTFSGDCDVNGSVYLEPWDQKICIITNNDIGAPAVVPPVPPLIDVVKVPNPLSLPKGPGPVQYTYTVRNIGPVPMTDVTMVGDTCSPIKLISGDTNSDSKLDLAETWVYTCTTTLTATHTNTVVATGWANGISAIDIASATVVVGKVVPPLIHVTKVPSPLTLLVDGGMVTYTEKITNPGTVALSNVKLTDDKCSPMKFISGDTNKDSKLDTSETWTYTCRAYLSETTTNTATATGEANGLTVKDLALATVVVAAPAPVVETPKLPNTGFGPSENNVLPSALASGIFAISLLIYIIRKKESV